MATTLSLEEQQRILSKLKDEGFVDDQRYAECFCREKYRFNNWGPIKIAQALRAKQINSSIIAQVIAELERERTKQKANGENKLVKLLYKKLQSIPTSLPTEKRYVRLMRWALSKGFTYEETEQIVRRITKTNESVLDEYPE
ncbi:recombination regulator RecX [Porphyromonas crevioricanis]|uniref:Regulatory protein RecX n=2 Tax=Porphyromonas crevioricanis TaxID=393921 RepID=A0A2X4SIB8_9PORP|nr:regulatory protein [Porphyromonas crevioricanis]SQH73672.1 recombination regulator RecX [Porphyromonas crevioricanis]